jgi:dTDP-4-dehydrorhamnose reductase
MERSGTAQNILLIGNNGQVGFELATLLPALGRVRTVDFPEIDLSKPDSIRAIVRDSHPDLIINAAAYTAVDKAESEPGLCHAINATAPAVLAEEAVRIGATLIHYSTDFVFDGAKRTPYSEDDTPNPVSVYGRTKLEGDNAILASGANHLIFRTAWVYGRRGKNFLLTLQRLAAEGKPLRVVADQIGCPTWSRVIAETTVTVLGRLAPAGNVTEILSPGGRSSRDAVFSPGGRSSCDAASGLYNLVCTGATSWHGFAREFTPNSTPITPISSADYPTPARRPAYSVLDCTKLQRTFGISLPSWQSALQNCLQK